MYLWSPPLIVVATRLFQALPQVQDPIEEDTFYWNEPSSWRQKMSILLLSFVKLPLYISITKWKNIVVDAWILDIHFLSLNRIRCHFILLCDILFSSYSLYQMRWLKEENGISYKRRNRYRITFKIKRYVYNGCIVMIQIGKIYLSV